MDISDQTQDKLVQTYVNLRSAVAEYEDKIEDLKKKQVLISDKILEHCAENNMDGFKTPFGTVSRRIRHSYWTTDWESMYSWIEQRGALHLLQKRLHDGNLREFMEENPEDLPPGLQSKKAYNIVVTKPRKSN